MVFSALWRRFRLYVPEKKVSSTFVLLMESYGEMRDYWAPVLVGCRGGDNLSTFQYGRAIFFHARTRPECLEMHLDVSDCGARKSIWFTAISIC